MFYTLLTGRHNLLFYQRVIIICHCHVIMSNRSAAADGNLVLLVIGLFTTNVVQSEINVVLCM